MSVLFIFLKQCHAKWVIRLSHFSLDGRSIPNLYRLSVYVYVYQYTTGFKSLCVYLMLFLYLPVVTFSHLVCFKKLVWAMQFLLLKINKVFLCLMSYAIPVDMFTCSSILIDKRTTCGHFSYDHFFFLPRMTFVFLLTHSSLNRVTN